MTPVLYVNPADLPGPLLLLMWGEKDSNLRSRKTTDLQSVPFGHSGISPICLAARNGAVFTPLFRGADGGIRTPDPLITNQ